MIKNNLIFFTAFALLIGIFTVPYPVKTKGFKLGLPSVFSDSMILQRGKPIVIWGKDSPGKVVTVSFNKANNSATTDVKGEWLIKLPSMKSGGPYNLNVSDKTDEVNIRNVLIGDVWVCAGQSNMNFMIVAAKNGEAEIQSLSNDNIREFRCEMPDGVENPENSEHSKWIPAIGKRAAKFSAVAYYFAKEIQQAEHIPIGIIIMSCGDTRAESWMPEDAIKNDPHLSNFYQYWDLHRHDNTIPFNHRPAEFYNEIVKPLTSLPIKGVIWYQGESNTLPDNSGRSIVQRAYEYKPLLSDLVKTWRKKWNEKSLPFYIVQLPNYKDPSGNIDWAEIRQAQLEVVKETAHTGLAVTIDLGDSTKLHPENKAVVGERLAKWALKNEYGKTLVVSGPFIKNMKFSGKAAVLTFDFATDGLRSKSGSSLSGFTISDASSPGNFLSATAFIKGNKVIVSNPSVGKPAAVRYAWSDNPPVSLYNNAALPASPFVIKPS